MVGKIRDFQTPPPLNNEISLKITIGVRIFWVGFIYILLPWIAPKMVLTLIKRLCNKDIWFNFNIFTKVQRLLKLNHGLLYNSYIGVHDWPYHWRVAYISPPSRIISGVWIKLEGTSHQKWPSKFGIKTFSQGMISLVSFYILCI